MKEIEPHNNNDASSQLSKREALGFGRITILGMISSFTFTVPSVVTTDDCGTEV